MRPSAYSTSASPDSACASHSASRAARARSSARSCARCDARASPRANSKQPRRYAARDASRARPAAAASGSARSSTASPASADPVARCAATMPSSALQRCTSSAGMRERALERGDGGRHVAGVAREIAFEARQLAAHAIRRRQFAAAPRETQRRVDPQRRRLRARRGQVGRRGLRIVGAVEVQRAQRRVAAVVPLRGPQVQRAPRAVQQRRIRAVADQCVREREAARIVRVRPHEIAAEQRAGVVRRIAEQMPQQREVEALAHDGRRLHGGLVRRRQPVEPGEHDALDRAGNRGAVGAAAQQLRQEQRVALRALDAAQRDVRVRAQERLRERQRVVRRKRRHVPALDRDVERRDTERIAFAPRRADEQQPRAPRGVGERAQAREHPGGGPVHVLDQQHQGTRRRFVRDRVRERAQPAFPARRVVHRLVRRRRALRDREQVGRERLVVGRDPPVRDRDGRVRRDARRRCRRARSRARSRTARGSRRDPARCRSRGRSPHAREARGAARGPRVPA